MVGLLLAPQSTLARPDPKQATSSRASDDAIALLDGDAGLVVSVRVSQFERLLELAVESFPEARGSINLAAMGATAMLGFQPFQTASWVDRGFSAQSKILVQVGAINRSNARMVDRGKGATLWRTRIILRAADAKKARVSLSRIRFRQRAGTDSQSSDKDFAAMLDLDDRTAAKLKKKLQGAGVFFVAKPAPLPGLLLISQRKDLFVVDLLAAYGPSDAAWKWGDHQSLLLQTVRRRPDALGTPMPGASALRDAPVALWLRTAQAGESLAAAELDGVAPDAKIRRRPRCEAFAALARHSEFPALSLRAEFHTRKLALDLRWHIKPESKLPTLLTTASAPLLTTRKQALHAIVRLAQPGAFRGRARAPVAKAWDVLWDSARRCGTGSKAFSLAVAWPEILGLFLDELSALHPQARAVIDSLGALAISAQGNWDEQELVAEAWVREPGAQFAKQWLKTLFGHEKQDDRSMHWGRGRIRPYAIAKEAGSVIGAFLGPGRQARELASTGARGSAGDSIFQLRAQPSALRPEILPSPIGKILSSWRELSANLSLSSDTLHFTMDLRKD